jgi:hypothetical protein
VLEERKREPFLPNCEELINRDKASLDIFGLRHETLDEFDPFRSRRSRPGNAKTSKPPLNSSAKLWPTSVPNRVDED